MKRNRVILIILGILFLIYLSFYANEFSIRTRTNFWIIPTRITLILLSIFLLLLLRIKWWIKLLFLNIFIGFILFIIPRTGLWKYSLRKYVEKEKREYIKFANEINKIDVSNLTYLSCHNKKINTRPKLDEFQIENMSNSVCQYFEKLDCIEVSLNKEKGSYLFIMSRFIDNGYGLLYSKKESIVNKRMNGYQITSMVKAENNWYYVSFT